MAISDVRTAIYQDLQAITTGNGFNYTYDTIFRVEKTPDKVNATQCPAITFFLTAVSPKQEEESGEYDYNLLYSLLIFATADKDLDSSGDLEIIIGKMIEDLIVKFKNEANNLCSVDGVVEVILGDVFPFIQDNRAWAYIPLNVKYFKGE